MNWLELGLGVLWVALTAVAAFIIDWKFRRKYHV